MSYLERVPIEELAGEAAYAAFFSEPLRKRNAVGTRGHVPPHGAINDGYGTLRLCLPATHTSSAYGLNEKPFGTLMGYIGSIGRITLGSSDGRGLVFVFEMVS